VWRLGGGGGFGLLFGLMGDLGILAVFGDTGIWGSFVWSARGASVTPVRDDDWLGR